MSLASRFKRPAVLLGLAALVTSACTNENGNGPGDGIVPGTPNRLPGFESAEDFESYLDTLEPQSGSTFESPGFDAGVSAAPDEASATGSAEEAPANEEITNNQEAGVDEGGIVKNIGRFLVVLRHGRLHVVDTDAEGRAHQVAVSDVAGAADLNTGVWYDELLVSGREIVVVGYRYATEVVDEQRQPMPWVFGATELNRFTLADDGSLSRGATTWLESNDYYSGTNSASRLIDGAVVLYMPYGVYIFGSDGPEIHRPRNLVHTGNGRFAAQGEVFGWQDVLRAPEPPSTPVFHTIVRCPLSDVEGPSGGCRGKSLLTDGWATMYASSHAVYLWGWGDRVARLDLDDGTASVHTAGGYPANQFSFKDTGDTLHAVVTTEAPIAPKPLTPPAQADAEDVLDDSGDGEPLPTPDPTPQVRHLMLPIADFDGEGRQPVPAERQPVVAETLGWVTHQRYVGERFVMAVEEYDADGSPTTRLAAQRLDGSDTRSLELSGRVTRIDSVGKAGALIVWNDRDGALHLDTLPPAAGETFELRTGLQIGQTAEGEFRSHGFFFKALERGGLFGLPVVGESTDPEGWYGNGVSNVAFFDVGPEGDLAAAGGVSAGVGEAVSCEVSCVDWYGNTRPIFLRDRIFALMGNELAELSRHADGRLAEIGERARLGVE